MKILLLFTLSFSVFAATTIDQEIEKIAKNIRQQYHSLGHEDVSTDIKNLDVKELNLHIEDYSDVFPFHQEEELQNCLMNEKCELYLISVSSEYYGGYGVTAVLVMLNVNSFNFKSAQHLMYAE